MTEAPLIDSFAEIEDPRHPRNTLYPIEEILLLAICGAISGADDFVSIAEFGEAKIGWLRGLLPFEHGVPSHDTLTRVFGQIEPSEFERCFRAWTRRVEEKTDGQVVAIDGKILRGSRDRASGEGPLHLVEAWACGQNLMLGQRRSEDGANEIETIPELLEMLTLEGCIVTTDAMGCQTNVAEAVTEAGADYVLRLKDNQSALRADVERLFERQLDFGFGPGHTDVDAGHGRVETRRCWAVDVAGKGLVDESRWPGLQSVALVETERFVAEPQAEAGPVEGETETEHRYLISSLKADAEKILEASRRHWQIENGLHWVLDVAFEEDHSQVRTQNAAENLALVRRLVASAVKQDDRVDAGTKNKRKRAGWDDDYREHLLQNL
ncbi:ISAs1 family transposase [Salinibacter ruber]|uniref:ISAs1 family transposase n=1 Tax=Salinibacter ruber TaxID=146919 RepID=UPI0021678A6C|nr:ISAs1 family transposase [Salinibacter ruber]MCS4185020.1 putative transposase YbfD/YdcC [Salinibacter ruber]